MKETFNSQIFFSLSQNYQRWLRKEFTSAFEWPIHTRFTGNSSSFSNENRCRHPGASGASKPITRPPRRVPDSNPAGTETVFHDETDSGSSAGHFESVSASCGLYWFVEPLARFDNSARVQLSRERGWMRSGARSTQNCCSRTILLNLVVATFPQNVEKIENNWTKCRRINFYENFFLLYWI